MDILNNLNREAGRNIAILNIDFFPSSSDRAVSYCSTIGKGTDGIEVIMENHWLQDGDNDRKTIKNLLEDWFKLNFNSYCCWKMARILIFSFGHSEKPVET